MRWDPCDNCERPEHDEVDPTRLNRLGLLELRLLDVVNAEFVLVRWLDEIELLGFSSGLVGIPGSSGAIREAGTCFKKQ